MTVKSWDPDSEEVSYELFGLDLQDGHIKDRSGKITYDKDGTATIKYRASNGVISPLDPKYLLQRTGLLEANDRIYLGFGTHMDTQPSHGWLLAYNADNLRSPPRVYCTTCGTAFQKCKDEQDLVYRFKDKGDVCMGGIWQAGAGPAVDPQGNIYIITGNGSYTGNSAGTDLDVGNRASSFIKLDRDLNVLGSWTPANYACLNRTDSDLGSAGALFISDLSILVGGGKEGLLYAFKPEALQGAQIGAGNPKTDLAFPCNEDGDPIPKNDGSNYWSIQAAPPWQEQGLMDILGRFRQQTVSTGFHHIHGSPVLWKVHDQLGDHRLLYVSAERDLLRAYEFNDGFGAAGLPPVDDPASKPVSKYQSACPNSAQGMPGGFLTLSANGDSAKSGIIWASMPRWNQDAVGRSVPGILRAYRAYPNDGSATLTEIWNSDSGINVQTNDLAQCGYSLSSGTDEVGSFAKFAPPTVAEGKVYLATFSDKLMVYGLKPKVPAALGATERYYNATLEMGHMPKSVQPGSTVAVTIIATNTGTTAWHAGDGISLDSSTIPANLQRPVEGDDALKIRADVPPGKNYPFKFHLVMPADESRFYFRWRLARKGAGNEETGSFGSPTSEWDFTTLRNECADLRKRTNVLAKEVSWDQPLSNSLKTEIDEVVRESQRRRCLPQLGIEDQMTN